MRRLIALAVTLALVLLVSGIAWARATTETYNIRQPESFTIDNPCQGYEEPILFEGVFHFVVQTTQVEGNFYHYTSSANLSNVTGTGLETGDEYRFINPYSNVQGSFNADNAEGGVANTVAYNVSNIVVSKGASPNFMLHEQYHLVLDDDSNPNFYRELLSIRCTGGTEVSTPTASAQPTP